MNNPITPIGFIDNRSLNMVNAKTGVSIYVAAQGSYTWCIPVYLEQPVKDCRTCFHCNPNNGCERPSDVKCEKGSNHTPTETLELWK